MERETKTGRILLATGLLLLPAVVVFLTLPHPNSREVNAPTGPDAVLYEQGGDREASARDARVSTAEPEASPAPEDECQGQGAKPASVVCRLVDAESGRLLRDEPVSVIVRGGSSVRPMSMRTDGEGIYRLRGLQPGLYALHTRHHGYIPEQRSVKVTEPETSDEHAKDPPPIEIHLVSGAELKGEVVTQTGQPVAGAHLKLTLLGKEGPQNAPARADESGAFTIKGLRSGVWRLAAFHQGYRHGHAEITVPQAGRVRVQLEVDPGFDVLVADSSGHAVRGARVRQLGRTHGISGQKRSALTGDDGRVHLDGLPTGFDGKVKVEVSHPDYLPHQEVVTGEEIAKRALAIVLTKGVQISGRVVNSSGYGIPNAEVRLSGAEKYRRTLATNSTGNFQFNGVKPGTYNLEAGATEYRAETLARVEVEAELETRELEFTLEKNPAYTGGEEPRSPSGSVTGFVFSKEPLKSFTIRVRRENVEDDVAGERTFRFSSRSPWFHLRYLTPGSYTLSLVVGGEVLALVGEVKVCSGQTTGPIELQQG